MPLDLYSIIAQAGSDGPPPRTFNVRASALPTPYWTTRLCQAKGTSCNNRVITVPVNGVDQTSLHCRFHACMKVERGQLCREAKLPKSASYCNEHLICTAMGSGSRCTYDVKNGNASKYSYCDVFHLCRATDCTRQRFQSDNDQKHDYEYCDDHRCGSIGCCRQRKGRGPFCSEHICETEGCYNEAHRNGSSPRLCDRHKKCRAGHCGRVCDVWEDNQIAPHCAAHCCQIRGCEGEKRSSARYCASHQCGRENCNKPRVRGGTLCEEHECARGTCRDRRRGTGRFCPAHTCARRGCESEAGVDRYCSWHGPGSEYQRLHGTAHRTGLPSWPAGRLCPHRHPDSCRNPDCIEHGIMALGIHGPIGASDGYANFTECDYRLCDDLCRQGHLYCRRHRCEMGNCIRLKSGLSDLDSREPAPSSRFCAQHECDVPRCTNQGSGNRTYCGDHTCRGRSCERKVAHPGSAYCNSCERGGSAGRWEDHVYDGRPAYSHASTGFPVWPQYFRRA